MKRKALGRRETTCYVVAYDIPDDRRRIKVHHILMGFGKWTQYSLFECFLTRKDVILLQAKPGEYLINIQDSVRFYPLCANCVEKLKPPMILRQRMSSSSWYKLSRERRSDALSERRLSHGSASGWKAKMSRQALLYSPKNRLFFGASRKLLPGTASYAILRGQQAKWLGMSVRNSCENSGMGEREKQGARKQPSRLALGTSERYGESRELRPASPSFLLG